MGAILAKGAARKMAFFEALGTLRAEYERVVAENRALQVPTPLEKPSKTEVAVKKAVPKKETKEINVTRMPKAATSTDMSDLRCHKGKRTPRRRNCPR